MKVNQLKVGVFLSYFQMALGIVIGIIQAPIVIRCLGQSEYGLYNTIASTISMLSILSLGFNSGYIRYYSKYKKEGNLDAIYRLNGLYLLIFLIIGVIGFACGLFLTLNLDLVFSNGLTQSEYETAKVLMFILTVNMAVTFPVSVFQNIISAHEKYVVLKLLGMVRTVLNPLIVIPLVLMGHKSISLAIVNVSVSFLVDVCFILFVFLKLKQKFYFKNFEKGIFRSLFGFTAFIAINMIVDEINTNVDKILLSRYRGTISAAVYTVGFTLYNFYKQFSVAVSGVFSPRTHRIYNEYRNDEVSLRTNLTNIFIKVGRVQFLILALVASGFVFFGKPFIHFWAGDGYQSSYYVGLFLMLPATVALIQNVGIEIQRAENKHKFRSISYLIMAIINIVLTIFLCQAYGEVGAAIGTAISYLLANGIIMNVYYHKACYINVLKFWKEILKMLLGLIVPCCFGVLIMLFINLYVLWKLLVFILVYVVIYALSMWFIGMNSYERNLVKKPFRRLFKGDR